MPVLQSKTLLWTACAFVFGGAVFCLLCNWLILQTADEQSSLEKLFSLSLSDRHPEPKLRSNLLQRLPIGSSKSDVTDFLHSSRLLTGRNYAHDSGDKIDYVDYRTVHMPFGILVQYHVIFLLDRDLKLDDIQICRDLTGP